MITFKVGILGAGAIAARIADCLNELSGFTPYAIASRDEAKATAFAVAHCGIIGTMNRNRADKAGNLVSSHNLDRQTEDWKRIKAYLKEKSLS